MPGSEPNPRNCPTFLVLRWIYRFEDIMPSFPRWAITPLTMLSEDEQLFRESCRSFAEAGSSRSSGRWTRKRSSTERHSRTVRSWADGHPCPGGVGRRGGTFFMSVLAVEEISRVDASFGVFIDVQNTLVNNAIMRWANDEQKRKYLPRLAKDTVGAYALSEAGSGSDAFALACRARRTRAITFVLNGRKLWITNAMEAGLFIVFANVKPEDGYKGITAFLIERDFPGFTVGKEGRQARHSRVEHLRIDSRRLPGSEGRTCSAKSARVTRLRSKP